MNAYDVIIKPVLTEKAYAGIAAKKYCFYVRPDATKTDVKTAVEKIFEVEVESVNIIQRAKSMIPILVPLFVSAFRRANDLAMAQEKKKAAFTKYFPDISASGGGFLANKGLMHMSLAPGMDLSLMDKGLVGGISAALPLFRNI